MVEVVTSGGFVDTPRLIQGRAQRALQSSPISELRELRVEQRDGSLLITGTVSSFYHKQLAQEVLRATCRGYEIDLVNSIRVRSAR